MESMESHEAGFPLFPHPLENPCGISHITTAAATTIVYLRIGKGRRKPAVRATFAALGL
jgi:hypothetical protein